MTMSVLLVQLAGQRIAVPALEVDSVIELDRITPVPGAPDHIRGLATLRSRALTVLDCAKLLEINDYEEDSCKSAVVFNFDGHDYAMLVDQVEDVADTADDAVPVPGGAGEAWAKISEGLVDTSVGPAMLVKTDALIKSLN